MPARAGFPCAPPLAALNGRKIGLVWTVFTNGNLMPESLGDLLSKRFLDLEFVKLPPGRNATVGKQRTNSSSANASPSQQADSRAAGQSFVRPLCYPKHRLAKRGTCTVLSMNRDNLGCTTELRGATWARCRAFARFSPQGPCPSRSASRIPPAYCPGLSCRRCRAWRLHQAA